MIRAPAPHFVLHAGLDSVGTYGAMLLADYPTEWRMQVRGAVGVKALWGRLASVSSSAFAAACCLGMPVALAALGVFGATFLLTDAFLIPMLALSLMLSAFIIFRQRRRHGRWGPFVLAVVASVAAVAGLFVHSAVVIGAIVLLVAANIWDYRLGHAGAIGESAEAASS